MPHKQHGTKTSDMRKSTVTDSELVRQYIKGDEAALAELMKRHQSKVYTSILFTVKNRAIAEDIFQDTFMKVVDTLRRGQYNEQGKFLQWVLRMAHNLCIDYFRKAGRMKIVEAEDGLDIFNQVRFSEESHQDKMELKQSQDKVRKLLDLLPPEQKDVVMLRHYFDFSFKEIAEMQKISINTALGRMRYGLINLRKLIAEKQIAI